ncbi:MAG: glycosyltransferase involved in cell wall biosynthesis [Bacteriovoracaceae bacterium]|jgi:glycosyltransferase involved in cell wall biosynthesis
MINNEPLVSVVMPVYNAEKYLGSAIESILNQSYKNLEIIIVDDASTDNSLSIIESFKDPRIKIFKNKSNLKIVKSLNLGISKASGKFVARMDADDISHEDRVKKQVRFLQDNEEIDILGTNIWIIDENSQSQGKLLEYPTSPEVNKLLLAKYCVLAHPTVMFRKKIIEENAELYSADFPCAEDYELWLRLSKKYKISNLKEFLLWYRVHPFSLTQNNYSIGIESVCRAIHKHNPLKIENLDLRGARLIRRPQEIKIYSDFEKTSEMFFESIELALVENDLTQSEVVELLKWNALFQIRSILQVGLSLRKFKFSSLRLIIPRKIFIIQILKLLFRDMLILSKMRKISLGKIKVS